MPVSAMLKRVFQAHHGDNMRDANYEGNFKEMAVAVLNSN